MRKVITGDGEYQKEQEIEYRETPYKEHRAFIGETEFDGHVVLWGFEYFPTTYLKSSGLSGNEWRKGGEIRYFRNREQVYSDFCRDPLVAANLIGATLIKLMDFPWDNIKLGAKVWYRELPCFVNMIIEKQGCVILKREDGLDFPDAVWYEKDFYGDMGKGEDRVKIEIISENLHWK